MTKLAQRIAIAAFAVFGLFGTAHAQKIAVVDINTIVTAMPEYQTANAKLEGLSKAYMDSLTIMRTQYQSKADAYAKVGETASAEFKKKSQEDLSNLQDQFSKFQEAKFGQTGELAQLREQLMKPITDKLQASLQSYAKKEHISVIIPKTATVYVEETLDLTTKFQEYLKAQASK